MFEQTSFADWEKLALRSLRDVTSVEQLYSETNDGLPVAPLYTERPATPSKPLSVSVSAIAVDNRLCVSGNNPKALNAQVLAGLSGGIQSLEIWIDDHNASLLSSDGLPSVLSGVLLNIAPISLRAGSSIGDAYGQLLKLWEAENSNNAQQRTILNVDPFDQLLTGQITSAELTQSVDQLSTLAEQHFNANSSMTCGGINIARHHNAGASEVEELTAAIATASLYAEALLDSGLTAEQASQTLVFNMACDSDFLLNVAKLRALRQLWAHVINALQPSAEPVQCRIDAVTSSRMQAIASPWVNHLRNTAASASAIIGGADSLTVLPHNHIEGVTIDSDRERGARMARNLPIILQEESHLHAVADPMAGSFAIEQLTQQLVDNTWQALINLERSGGWLNAVNSGAWQAQLANTHMNRVKNLQRGDSIRVGVNKYQPDDMPNKKVSNKLDHPTAQSGSIEPLTPVRDSQEFES